VHEGVNGTLLLRKQGDELSRSGCMKASTEHFCCVRKLTAPVAAALAISLGLTFSAAAAERSSGQRAAFQREHPCPATGERRGPCPGWVVDHIHPLCAGGADHPDNLQWQTVAEARVKDRQERELCRRRSAPSDASPHGREY